MKLGPFETVNSILYNIHLVAGLPAICKMMYTLVAGLLARAFVFCFPYCQVTNQWLRTIEENSHIACNSIKNFQSY
jgi:hypothetical protein